MAMVDFLAYVYVLRFQHLSKPHFISYLQPNWCVGTLTRWKNKHAEQLLGEKHPRASAADILVLSSVVQLCIVYLHDFLSLSLISVISRQSRKSLSV